MGKAKKRKTNRYMGYISLATLSIIYGTSYAFVSKAIQFYEGSILNSIRMCFAFLGGSLLFVVCLLTKKDYFERIKTNINLRSASIALSLIGGILNYGFPHSLITIAQKHIPSIVIIISQPFVSVFTYFLTLLLTNDEVFSFANFLPHLVAIIGSTISTLPKLSADNHEDTRFNALSYVLLFFALLSFAFGSVFIRKFLSDDDPILVGTFQLLGSASYSTIFAIFRNGFTNYLGSIDSAGINNIIYPLILGLVFTCSSAFLSIICINSLGPIIFGYANYGQIIIGVVVGVVFMHEWDNYNTNQIIISFFGLAILAASMAIGILHKTDKKDSDELPFLLL